MAIPADPARPPPVEGEWHEACSVRGMLTSENMGIAAPQSELRREPAGGRARESIRPPLAGRVRLFDLQREDTERLIGLKERVYGRPVDRAAFRWEHFGHPRSREIRVFVADDGGRLAAATTRLPATLRIDGVDRPAYFNVDSMVDPAHRRRGLMRELYLHARQKLGPAPLLFSKGSSDEIYPLLLGVGQRELLPNTRLVSYPSAARWLLSHLHRSRIAFACSSRVPGGFDDFEPIERYDGLFDAFFERVSRQPPALFVRDAAFMNWRYLQCPHRRYSSFQRRVGDRISSVVVVHTDGDTGQIVDLVWDAGDPEEPARTVRFTQALLEERRVVRIACFATHPALRGALGRAGFLDRGHSPRLSVAAPPSLEGAFTSPLQLHIMDGDGDTEFS